MILVNIVELSLSIIVVYKQPPVSADILINLLIPLIENRGKCIVLGDFNINLLNDSIATNQYTHTMLSRGLIFLNKIDEKFATRAAERTINQHALTSKTVIDHVLTNCLNYSYSFSITDTPISDHKIIALAFDDCKKSNFIQMEKTVTLNRLNEQNFNAELENMLCNLSNLDELPLGEFTSKIENIKLNCLSTFTRNEKYNPTKKWITNNFLELIRQRKRYFLLKKNPQIMNISLINTRKSALI